MNLLGKCKSCGTNPITIRWCNRCDEYHCKEYCESLDCEFDD